MIANETEVNDFLVKVRDIIDSERGLYLVNRSKNLNSLDRNGFTIEDVKYFIKDLKVKNYFKGPEKDHIDGKEHCWWFFGKEISNKLFYIKIRVVNKGMKQVVCLSFHEAKYEIDHYPYS